MTDERTPPHKQKPESLKMIRIKYIHSAEGAPADQQRIISSLGLTKVGQTVERPDTKPLRTQLEQVPHLLRIIE